MNTSNPHLNSAYNTIATQIQAIQALRDFLDEKYIQAVDLILSCNGKVILSGMGKSGHIAKKISASLASTGTPSFFVHPAEASHGDLGMIEKNDVVILLSNSGETKELRDIIFYCQRFKIPIIGISRKFGSELANSSTIALTLPAISEANKVNAPITSTTMMLILGDCITLSLVEARNFSAENFATFHPGGKLGSAFVKVGDIMRKENLIPTCKINQKIPEILFEMTSKHLGCTAVLDENNKIVGIITDGDLRRHICNNFLELSAQQIMTKNPITISSKSLASDALSIMKSKAITSIFVAENQNILGIIHIHDCINAGI